MWQLVPSQNGRNGRPSQHNANTHSWSHTSSEYCSAPTDPLLSTISSLWRFHIAAYWTRIFCIKDSPTKSIEKPIFSSNENHHENLLSFTQYHPCVIKATIKIPWLVSTSISNNSSHKSQSFQQPKPHVYWPKSSGFHLSTCDFIATFAICYSSWLIFPKCQ